MGTADQRTGFLHVLAACSEARVSPTALAAQVVQVGFEHVLWCGHQGQGHITVSSGIWSNRALKGISTLRVSVIWPAGGDAAKGRAP